RYAISMLGDGDFCMGATAIWSAARHRIPLLVLINNNRSYFNDELHQDNVARTRGREVKNRWIGLRMEDPVPNIAKLAEAQGAVGKREKRSTVTDDAGKPWPTELRLHKDRKTLTVSFDSGQTFDLAAEYLRVRSPSAEVQGHSPAERKIVGGKRNVAILEVHP